MESWDQELQDDTALEGFGPQDGFRKKGWWVGKKMVHRGGMAGPNRIKMGSPESEN